MFAFCIRNEKWKGGKFVTLVQPTYLDPMSLTYCSIAQLCYAEINHSDWLKWATSFGAPNQSALSEAIVVLN